MTCASCGSQNRLGRRFCGRCGAVLARSCAACGATNQPDDDFCGDCGAALGETAAVRPPASRAIAAARTTERRHVTVLFVDLVGFTALSSQRDAEDVRELLSRYFATARTVISRHGGSVEKFIGDAVMAVWGTQVIRENDAERAVRAALELLDAVAAFGDEVGAPALRARAGVLTGEAAVTLGAVGEGMVAGDLVNTASRVQAVAQPGTVYVGGATRQATESVVVYTDAGAHQLKGLASPLRLWRAERVVAGNGGTLRPQSLEAPFVGRERELRLLKEYLHATSEQGKARLLSVVGVAGVGKSRLAWEFFKYVDGLSQAMYWHRGRCLPYGEGVAYAALSDMVRMRAGITENEPLAAARAKLSRTVAEIVSGEAEQRWVEPRLAQLIGAEDGSASDAHDLYAAWRFFFEQMAARDLTVLVFEDMQWADSGLLDFVEYLLEWSRSSPILVITLARPEICDSRPGWGTGKRGVSSLYLEPLTADAMTALLDGIVPGLPAELSARVCERAAGIPLYAVETVRMLLDHRLLVEHDGAYEATGPLDSLDVPENLHALIAARIDSLAAVERCLLQDAAVLGTSFTATALRAVTEVEGGDVARGLAALVDKDLLTIQADPRSPERGHHVFVQDLVRSVAYGTLARRDRKARHLAAAAHLEEAAADEDDVAEVVAAHLVAAHAADLGAADATTIRERAGTALVRAGDHAASLAAAHSAQRYYERALELADGDQAKATLHLRAGQMAWMHGHAGSATAHFEAAITCCGPGDGVARARALTELAGVKGGGTELREAIELSQRALQVLTEMGADEHDAELAEIEAYIGKYLYFVGDLGEALSHTERALDVAESAGLPEVLALALDVKGCILAARGRLAEAEILELAALRIAIDEELPEVTVIANNAGATLEEADRPEAALALYEEGEVRSRRLGDRRRAVHTTLARVEVLIELGRWDEAETLYRQYVDIDEPVIQGYLSGYAGSLNMVQLYVWRGDLDSARRLLAKVEPMLADADPEMTAELRAARAVLLNAEGEPERAMVEADAALRGSLEPFFPLTARKASLQAADSAFALGRLDDVEDGLAVLHRRHRSARNGSAEAHMQRWQARLASARGDAAAAAEGFQRAVRMFDELHRPFWAAVARLDHGELLLRTGTGQEGRGLLEAARAAFHGLRAAPWVERVDAVLAGGEEERNAVGRTRAVPLDSPTGTPRAGSS